MDTAITKFLIGVILFISLSEYIDLSQDVFQMYDRPGAQTARPELPKHGSGRSTRGKSAPIDLGLGLVPVMPDYVLHDLTDTKTEKKRENFQINDYENYEEQKGKKEILFEVVESDDSEVEVSVESSDEIKKPAGAAVVPKETHFELDIPDTTKLKDDGEMVQRPNLNTAYPVHSDTRMNSLLKKDKKSTEISPLLLNDNTETTATKNYIKIDTVAVPELSRNETKQNVQKILNIFTNKPKDSNVTTSKKTPIIDQRVLTNQNVTAEADQKITAAQSPSVVQQTSTDPKISKDPK